ncbi:MAG: L,D-transpeptidase family protein [Gammaproteobacteria bacterium]|nr:L,D-transpeptidase family protein [Gammaproteobacteria bacterium]MDH3468853.1 L,D-transpeptidase family protein [Gammaproteobacteria bacterium]
MNRERVGLPNQPRACAHLVMRGFAPALAAVLLAACQYLPASISEVLEPIGARTAPQSFVYDEHQDVVGELAVIKVRRGDTAPGIARHFGLGFDEIEAANPGIDMWLPQPGSRIVLPLRFNLPDAPRHGVVLNLASMRLFQFSADSDNRIVYTYPIGIGREGWSTPTGSMRIIEKKESPTWRVPASIRKEHARNGDPLPATVPPGPENPLGSHALRLSRPAYLLHGTNKPFGVGMRSSHGCVRLYPEHITELYSRVATGTNVNIVDQPFLSGWRDNMLYVEAHPPLQTGDLALQRHVSRLVKRLKKTAKQHPIQIDWDRVKRIVSQQRGIPEPVLEGAPHLNMELDTVPQVWHPLWLAGTPKRPRQRRDAWYVQTESFHALSNAQRLSVVLNHEGPPIPARWVATDTAYHVIVGPFDDESTAQNIARRIKREYEFNGTIVHGRNLP